MVSAITASMALVHETLRGGEGVWWEHTLRAWKSFVLINRGDDGLRLFRHAVT